MTRIVVSVGTHEQPFQRLLDQAAVLVRELPEIVWIIQYGTGSWDAGLGTIAARYFGGAEMNQLVADADILVSQASPGNIFGALAVGTWPIAVGRQHAFKEHVDDHQVAFAHELEALTFASEATVGNLRDMLLAELDRTDSDRRARCARAHAGSVERTHIFRSDFWSMLAGLVQ